MGRGNRIAIVRSSDLGRSFAEPVEIETGGVLALGNRRGPRLAITSRAWNVAAVVGAQGRGADGDVRLWRSTDSGASWTASPRLNAIEGSAREGFVALAAHDSGLLVATWLDLRSSAMQVYAAISSDHGATWAKDVLVHANGTAAVCECCHSSVAVSDGGRAIAVMFRNNVTGARDMYVSISHDRGQTFAAAEKLGAGTWPLQACPMDGGDIVWHGASLLSVWRREDDLFVAAQGTTEQKLAPGTQPEIAEVGQHTDLVWTTMNGQIALKRGAADPIEIGAGRFPSLVALPAATLVAWEQGHQSIVARTPR